MGILSKTSTLLFSGFSHFSQNSLLSSLCTRMETNSLFMDNDVNKQGHRQTNDPRNCCSSLFAQTHLWFWSSSWLTASQNRKWTFLQRSCDLVEIKCDQLARRRWHHCSHRAFDECLASMLHKSAFANRPSIRASVTPICQTVRRRGISVKHLMKLASAKTADRWRRGVKNNELIFPQKNKTTTWIFQPHETFRRF